MAGGRWPTETLVAGGRWPTETLVAGGRWPTETLVAGGRLCPRALALALCAWLPALLEYWLKISCLSVIGSSSAVIWSLCVQTHGLIDHLCECESSISLSQAPMSPSIQDQGEKAARAS